MSLRSSELTSSIGRLTPFTLRPPAAFCCSAPHQEIWLLAGLRARGGGAGTGDRVADAHRCGLRDSPGKPALAAPAARACTTVRRRRLPGPEARGGAAHACLLCGGSVCVKAPRAPCGAVKRLDSGKPVAAAALPPVHTPCRDVHGGSGLSRTVGRTSPRAPTGHGAAAKLGHFPQPGPASAACSTSRKS